MSAGLRAIYTEDELKDLLKQARAAYHSITTQGGVQEVRTIDRLTRFHQANAVDLLAWIHELEGALGLQRRARSSPVYF